MALKARGHYAGEPRQQVDGQVSRHVSHAGG